MSMIKFKQKPTCIAQ